MLQFESNICICSWDSNFKVDIQDSIFIKGGIQDSNLNLRKMAGIQDSNLVFMGPNLGSGVFITYDCRRVEELKSGGLIFARKIQGNISKLKAKLGLGWCQN